MLDKPTLSVGGTVQANRGLYLSRPADNQLLWHCLEGDFCYVLTARQMGKSSLMIRTAEELNTRNVHTVLLDLNSYGTNLEADQWYLGLLDDIVEQLELQLDYRNWWQNHSHLSVVHRLGRFLRERVLTSTDCSVVIFVDEIDTTLSLPFSDDFFAAIRACYNARSIEPIYKRLSFVLLGVATPGELIRDSKRTPFNIGKRIDLTDFTLEQATPLATALGLPMNHAYQVLIWILDWSNGHPYITQRLCQAVKEKAMREWTESDISKLVDEIFFGEKSQQDSNLKFVRDMLIIRIPKRYRLNAIQILRNIQRGHSIKDEEQSIAKMYLKLSGVVYRRGANLAIRNKVYERVFTDYWILENSSEFKKQRINIFMWMLSALLFGAFTTFTSVSYGKELTWYSINSLGFKQPTSTKSPSNEDITPTPTKEKNSNEPLMLLIPAGNLKIRGSDSYLDEQSVHQIYIDEFKIDVYEVTNSQYRKCVDAGGCESPEVTTSTTRNRYHYDVFYYNNFPVIYVSWHDANAFCSWRNARLPTEAEWEYAARGGLPNSKYPWKDGLFPICNRYAANGANFVKCPIRDTLRVGTFNPNGYGLYDMAGNVEEWVADWYSINPIGPTEGELRVVRGGSWNSQEDDLRVSNRNMFAPDYKSGELGFRCASSP